MKISIRPQQAKKIIVNDHWDFVTVCARRVIISIANKEKIIVKSKSCSELVFLIFILSIIL